MASSLGHLNGLVGVEAAGSGQDHDVGIGSGQQCIERPECWGAGALLGLPQCGRVYVADAHQLGSLRVLLDGLEMIGRDAPTPDQREPDSPVGDERFGEKHRPGSLHDGR